MPEDSRNRRDLLYLSQILKLELGIAICVPLVPRAASWKQAPRRCPGCIYWDD